jgi:hypothetical protein
MRSDHRRLRRRLRAIALGLTVSALLVPGAAFAAPGVGDTPADFPGTSAAPVAPKVGDTPADFPGTDGAPDVVVAPITVPGHTIVREAGDELPLILAGAALLIALATAAFTLRGVLTARRGIVRPSH